MGQAAGGIFKTLERRPASRPEPRRRAKSTSRYHREPRTPLLSPAPTVMPPHTPFLFHVTRAGTVTSGGASSAPARGARLCQRLAPAPHPLPTAARGGRRRSERAPAGCGLLGAQAGRLGRHAHLGRPLPLPRRLAPRAPGPAPAPPRPRPPRRALRAPGPLQRASRRASGRAAGAERSGRAECEAGEPLCTVASSLAPARGGRAATPYGRSAAPRRAPCGAGPVSRRRARPCALLVPSSAPAGP